MSTQQAPINIGFPLYQGVTLLDFCGATQVFAHAGNCKPVWIAENDSPVITSEGVSVNPQCTFADALCPKFNLDVLFVPGGSGDGVAYAMQSASFQQFLKESSDKAEWTGSVCVGAFILAAAGLLDGCTATTYWSVLGQLNRFPDIEVPLHSYPRFLVDCKAKRFSGGGVSSSIDLALELVKILRGEETAQLTALAIQYAPDPPVTTGDPSKPGAAPLVGTLRSRQKDKFILPITRATDRVIANSLLPVPSLHK